MKLEYDVAIIGGGPAGLSAALTLARGGRSVFIMDEGKARNAPAAHMMNFPTHDGTPPFEFRRLIREDLQKYPKVVFESGRVHSLERIETGFKINHSIKVKKVLMAHGVIDLMPDIQGAKELWGKSIFHCPYCHGYEHRNEPLGIIADPEILQHMAPLVKGLTHDLIIFTDGKPMGEKEAFEKNGIKIYEQKINHLIHKDEELRYVILESGEAIERKYLFMKPSQKLSTDLGVSIGCELNEFNLYKVDEMGMTTQEGIYAAGDIATLRQSALIACAMGSMTAAGINFSILQQEFLSNY